MLGPNPEVGIPVGQPCQAVTCTCQVCPQSGDVNNPSWLTATTNVVASSAPAKATPQLSLLSGPGFAVHVWPESVEVYIKRNVLDASRTHAINRVPSAEITTP